MAEPTHSLPLSGPQPGEHLAAFIVDDVTGEFPGERLCYVCHYGEGPVVLVFVQQIDERLGALAQELDQWTDSLRGARAFIVATTRDPEGDAEELRELATRRCLRLPLTLASEGEFGPHLYRLHPRVPITVVLYREKTVVRTLTAAGLTDAFRAQVLEAAAALGSAASEPQLQPVTR